MEKFFNSKIVSTILIVVVLFFLVSWGINKYLDLKADLRISEQNASALKDSIRVKTNKVGNLEFSKEILVAKHKSDLEGLNHRMAKMVKEYDGEINELMDLVATIKSDTVIIDNTKLISLPNNTNGFTWSYNEVFDADNSRSFAGITKFKLDSLSNLITPLQTVITKDEIKFNITQGIRTRKDGKVEMFASSKYPKFAAEELNSVIIDPSTHPALDKFTREKRFKLGVYAGYGATINLSTSNVTAGPQIGAGATYSLW